MISKVVILIFFTQTLGNLEPSSFYKVTENPGLLPIKVGNAQVQYSYWSFIQIFDLNNLFQEFYSLKNQYERMVNAFENKTKISDSYKLQFSISCNLAQTFIHKIDIQLLQINPHYSISTREKRGLINAFGSIIKIITGNLDQEDAEKYDVAIEHITSNQKTLNSVMVHQISLFNKSIQVFQNSIQNLSHNQIILKERINRIEELLYTMDSEAVGTYYYFYIEMIMSQMLTEFQIIYDNLEKIETAISFSKLNTFHNSIVNPQELLSEITTVNQQLSNNNKLPFEPNQENILLFEQIVTVKSYSKDNIINFILEIPIVEKEYYTYYHLYPIPMLMNNEYYMIIPQSKYLIINEQNYMFYDIECKRVTTENFICNNENPIKINSDSPCEIQLLKFSQNFSNCHLVPTTIQKLKIQKLNSNRWIIISIENSVVVETCLNNQEHFQLKGSYILEMKSGCTVKINNILLKNFGNNKYKFKLLTLPKLDIQHFQNRIVTSRKIKLNDVNLKELSAVKSALDNNLQLINENQIHYFSFNHFNGWIILIYTFLILGILLLSYKYVKNSCHFCKEPKGQRNNKKITKEIINLESENSSPNPRISY